MNITLVRLNPTGDLALVGNKEGVRALAEALDIGTHPKLYGEPVETFVAHIGERDFTDGVNNGTHYYTSAATGTEFEWHYRRGWVGRKPTRADFGL